MYFVLFCSIHLISCFATQKTGVTLVSDPFTVAAELKHALCCFQSNVVDIVLYLKIVAAWKFSFTHLHIHSHLHTNRHTPDQ